MIELRPRIATALGLSAKDLAERDTNGYTRFVNYLAWARVELYRAALLTGGRGIRRFCATETGKRFLRDHPESFTLESLKMTQGYRDWSGGNDGSPDLSPATAGEISEQNPEELIEIGFTKLEQELRLDLIARLQKEPPALFEQFIRDLLIAMK